MTYSPILLNEICKSKKLLLENNINPKVISMPWLNVFDKNWILKELNNLHLIIVEDHYVEGGFAEKISLAISKLDTDIKIDVIALEEVPKVEQTKRFLTTMGYHLRK